MNTTKTPPVRRPVRRRGASIVATATVLALIGAACSDDPDDTPAAATTAGASAGSTTTMGASNDPTTTTESAAATTSTTAAATTTSSGAEAASFEDVTCPSPNVAGAPSLDFPPTVECGYLTVPEDRSKPDGRKIRIFVMRLPATSPNPKPDPLVILSGGPGGGGSFQIASSMQKGWNAEREVIFVDQRGTHLADPLLSCPEYDEAVNDGISISFSSEEQVANQVAAAKVCRDRFTAAGIDVAAYNTAENAADIADLRVALGIEEWNVYGVSYGSKLALVELRDHPEGIRSLVLDSVSPPNNNIAEDWWSAPASSFKAIFAACAAEPACAAAYPNLEADFIATVNRLDESPVVVQTTDDAGQPLTVNIDAFPFLYAIIMATERGDASGVPKMIEDIAHGDPESTVAAMLALQTPPLIVGLAGLRLGLHRLLLRARQPDDRAGRPGLRPVGAPRLPGARAEGAAQAGPPVPGVPGVGRPRRRRRDERGGRERRPGAHHGRRPRCRHRPRVGRPHHTRPAELAVRGGPVDRSLGRGQDNLCVGDHERLPRRPDAAGRPDVRRRDPDPLHHGVSAMTSTMTRVRRSTMAVLMAASLAATSVSCGGERSTPVAPTTLPAPDETGGDVGGLVEVSGRNLYLECIGTGSPTVILQSGFGNAGDIWSFAEADPPAVQPGLAASNRVCSYDRPGSMITTTTAANGTVTLADALKPGRSEPAPMPRDPAEVVTELHNLLAAADVPGPYVLVGHSLGGALNVLYAHTYPDEVSASSSWTPRCRPRGV